MQNDTKRPKTGKWRRMVAGATAALAMFTAIGGTPAYAGGQSDVAIELQRLSERLSQQEERLAQQERALDEQRSRLQQQSFLIQEQLKEIAALRTASPETLEALRASGAPANPLGPVVMAGMGASDGLILLNQSAAADAAVTNAPPLRPVGEAPKIVEAPPIVAALPEGQGVLTPTGRLTVDASFDYTRSSSNRLVYRGVEIVTGIQVGLIEANDADRDTVVTSIAARYGITKRLEAELRLPYVQRNDRITTLAQRDTTVSRVQELDGSGIGDVEASLRYQINRSYPGKPVYVAGLRVKSDTGLSPFEVHRDSFGVAEELPVGSGFWGISPTLSVMIPSDPVVLFGNLSYMYTPPESFDRSIGGAFIGSVNPGDSIGAGFGFGFALNQRFSYSLGYQHQYLTETKTEIGGTQQQSPALHIGGFQFGMSYRMTPSTTLATSVEIGATKDSPDVRVSARVPFGVQLFNRPDRAEGRRSEPRREARNTRSLWERITPW
jgi:hypothetical protein